MAGKRQPTDIVKANGRKHMTKAEEDARRDSEVRVATAKKAKPPKWLPEGLKKDFRKIGKQLIEAGIYSELDADTLGRYLVAHGEWISATAEVQQRMNRQPRDVKAVDDWGKVQERYFKQARNCANDLGLTITSRCRLVIPQSGMADGAESGEDEFTLMLRERQRSAASG